MLEYIVNLLFERKPNTKGNQQMYTRLGGFIKRLYVSEYWFIKTL